MTSPSLLIIIDEPEHKVEIHGEQLGKIYIYTSIAELWSLIDGNVDDNVPMTFQITDLTKKMQYVMKKGEFKKIYM